MCGRQRWLRTTARCSGPTKATIPFPTPSSSGSQTKRWPSWVSTEHICVTFAVRTLITHTHCVKRIDSCTPTPHHITHAHHYFHHPTTTTPYLSLPPSLPPSLQHKGKLYKRVPCSLFVMRSLSCSTLTMLALSCSTLTTLALSCSTLTMLAAYCVSCACHVRVLCVCRIRAGPGDGSASWPPWCEPRERCLRPDQLGL